MDDSDSYQNQEAMREIEKAQKKLDDMENKMKKFRSRKKEQINHNTNKAPFPDLNKYFSFLTQQPEETPQIDENYYDNIKTKYPATQLSHQTSQKLVEKNVVAESDKQNNSLSINQKLQKEKNSSINKIEEYYIERNQVLEEKIRELKEFKDKVIRDQKLLIRNNQELDEEIEERRKHNHQPLSKAQQLKNKIQKLTNKIGQLETENKQIGERKKDLEKAIKQTLKNHKANLSQQLLTRPKSSNGRCHYH